MTVHYLYLLSDEDLPQNVVVNMKDGWMRGLAVHVSSGQVVDFKTIGQVSYPDSFVSIT